MEVFVSKVLFDNVLLEWHMLRYLKIHQFLFYRRLCFRQRGPGNKSNAKMIMPQTDKAYRIITLLLTCLPNLSGNWTTWSPYLRLSWLGSRKSRWTRPTRCPCSPCLPDGKGQPAHRWVHPGCIHPCWSHPGKHLSQWVNSSWWNEYRLLYIAIPWILNVFIQLAFQMTGDPCVGVWRSPGWLYSGSTSLQNCLLITFLWVYWAVPLHPNS